MKGKHLIAILSALAVIGLLVHYCFFRLDLTEDKRYSLSAPTKSELKKLEAPVEVRLLLDGELNASFLRLRQATTELLDEMRIYGQLSYSIAAPEEGEKGIIAQLTPVVIHERAAGGQTVQTTVWPFAIVRYQGREAVVSLLRNNRGLSGEENVNLSIEQLEFGFAEAISSLTRKTVRHIAFLEGHGELTEDEVYDLSAALSRYFQIDRGTLTGNVDDLLGLDAIVIAAPQQPFTDEEKYQLDQYIMHGGRILWSLDGVRFSNNILSQEGFTPVIAQELNVRDLLFRYGVRITPTLLQDMQCLPVPVDVSTDPANPNFQPMPWYYAPLLLTSDQSPVTRGLTQVSSTFCSAIEAVGEADSLRKTVLLATSTATRAIGVPAEVDLSLVELDPQLFALSFVPVAAAIEGSFTSLYAHRLKPEGVQQQGPLLKQSVPTRQIVIGSGSVLRNEVQHGKVLPLGYDRYTGMQFANRDFAVNALLYLTDEDGLIDLRQKQLPLRLLNDKRARDMRTRVQVLTCLVPLLLLAMTGAIFLLIRKKRYNR